MSKKVRRLDSTEVRNLRSLLELAPDAMVVVDQAGVIVLANSQAETLFGYRQEELLGNHVEVLIPKRFREGHRGHRLNFFSDPRVRPMGAKLQLFALRKNGTEFPVEISLSPVETPEGMVVVSAIRDVSERKFAEESRLRLAAIVESSEDAIISKTPDGVITSWNKGAQQVFGYTEAEAIGKPITILLPPELREEENKILERLRTGEHIEHYETVRVTKAGSRIDVSLSLSPVKDSSGRIVGFCKIARDITERKLAEQRLRESAERLRLAQRAAGIGSFEWNIQTGAESWTPELEAVYGLPPGGFGGRHSGWINLIHEDDLAEVQRLADETLKTGRPMTGEWRVVWPDGSVHWIAGRWQVSMDQYGKPWRVLGVNIDVTERRRTQDALVELNRTLEAQTALLQSSEELLKIFVKNVPAAVAMLDHELRYLQVSDRWCSDNGVKAQELLGRPREAYPEMPERWKEVNRRALQGETLRADEDSWESAGSTHWARWEVLPWRKPDGTVGGILVFAEDITRRKQMEEQLLGMSRKLIESQEQERTRIGRELHDDINQRLAMLAVELEQLKENPSEIESRVEELRKRTTEISNDVQALSHDLHSSKLEYLGVTQGMKSWCKEFAERREMHVNFRSDVKRVLPLDVGLPLFRVLQEALHNALKHSDVKRIEVELREGSDEIYLTVTDQGRGFDVEAAMQGQGLGLTSMQERVRLLNGTIEIQSKPMGGTTIHVRVPLEPKHATERPAV